MRYQPRAPYHTEAAGPGDSFPKLELFTGKSSYGVGQPVQIIAIAHGASGVEPFDAITGKTVGGKAQRPEIDLQWAEQSDGSQMAQLTLPPEVARANGGDWGVFVDCMIEGQHRIGTTQFDLTATTATVTGPYRVAVENKSLVLYAGITATDPSVTLLNAELWGPGDEPISYGWVRNEQTPVGPTTMRIVFYGKVIRDSGVDGPYRIKNLVLSTFDSHMDRIDNPAVDPDLVTGPLKHTDFTDVPINGSNDMLNEKRATLEGELWKAENNRFDPNQPDQPPPVGDRVKSGPDPQ
jgi:hypothetical protein